MLYRWYGIWDTKDVNRLDGHAATDQSEALQEGLRLRVFVSLRGAFGDHSTIELKWPRFDDHFFPMRGVNWIRIGKAFHANLLNQNRTGIRKATWKQEFDSLTGIAFASNWLIIKLILNFLFVKTTRMTTNRSWWSFLYIWLSLFNLWNLGCCTAWTYLVWILRSAGDFYLQILYQ